MRRTIKYGLYAAVLAGVLGSTIAWVSVDKTVTLQVDGQSRRVHTVASTVGDVLAGSGYKVSDHDLVAPSVKSSVHDGSSIVVKHGRMLRLTIDGTERDVWVTAPTVAEAMADLGYESADLDSVSRDKRLPLSPTAIDITTLKPVTVTVGGQVSTLTTTDVLVADLLSDLKITLGPEDIVTPGLGTRITADTAVVVQRVTHGDTSTQAPVPFTTTQIPDTSLATGTTKVVTSGHDGVQEVVYAVVYVDGVATGQTIVSRTVITAPTNEVVKVGAKPAPTSTPTTTPTTTTSAPAATTTIVVDPGSAQAIAQQMLLARGWGNDQFSCLAQLWGHESGWRVNAANASGAYGIPQALPGSKMASAGADWRTNPATQITWGLGYISGRYGTPCGAWSYWQSHNWY